MERSQIIDEIFSDYKLIGRAAKRGMKNPDGINHPSPAQMELIHIISSQGPVTVKDIAEAMGVSGSAVTQFADPLVKAGLVERAHDKEDRRIVRIQLSEDGRKRHSMLEMHGREHIAGMFEPLTDEELLTLRDLHRKIINNMLEKKETLK